MRKIPTLICLAIVACTSLMGQITVYPGDANASHLCNHVDLLYIGLHYGETGPPRNFIPNITWSPQQGAPWGGPAVVDPAHSDCDGDGLVDRFDVQAVSANFGLMHSGSILPDTHSMAGVNAPIFQLGLAPDTMFVSGQTSFTIAVNLGTPSNPLDSIYGFAATIDYDPNIVDVATFNFASGGWLLDSQSITFVHIDTTLGKIHVSATNIDHVNRSGSGTVATIGIVMDDDIRITGLWNLLLTPSYFLGLTSHAALVPVHAVGDTLVVLTGRTEPWATDMAVYPNPADRQVQVASPAGGLESLSLHDAQGRLLRMQPATHPTFETFDTQQLAPGCYFLEVRTSSGTLRRKLLIQHQ